MTWIWNHSLHPVLFMPEGKISSGTNNVKGPPACMVDIWRPLNFKSADITTCAVIRNI
jgi:hypothetical protein